MSGTLKTAAGTAIDMVSNVGMIEGTTLGAKLGTMIAIPGVGAAVGFVIGGINQGL